MNNSKVSMVSPSSASEASLSTKRMFSGLEVIFITISEFFAINNVPQVVLNNIFVIGARFETRIISTWKLSKTVWKEHWDLCKVKRVEKRTKFCSIWRWCAISWNDFLCPPMIDGCWWCSCGAIFTFIINWRHCRCFYQLTLYMWAI